MDLLTANDRPGTHAPSYYSATANAMPDRPALAERLEVDVCVIGGGFTGLSAALELALGGASVVLLDAQRIGWGASGRNGGQIATGPRVSVLELERSYGRDMTRALWDLAEDAKALIRRRVADHGIACDLKAGSVHAETTAAGARAAAAEADHIATQYDYAELTPLNRAELAVEIGSEAYAGGLLDTGAGHLHPLNYALGVAEAAEGAGAKIYEQSRVTGIEGDGPYLVRTEAGEIRAEWVVIATNGYTGPLDEGVSSRVMPINNFIAATEPLGEDRARALIPRDGCVADSRFVVGYWRFSADHRLLFGGGETYRYRFPTDIAEFVRPRMAAVYPSLADVKIDYAWGGTLGITASRMPYLSRSGQRIAAAGYSGQGVAMTGIAGRVVSEEILGERARFATLAALRHQRFPGGGRLRHPLLVLAMTWYALRDRLGI
ncbi:MAG: FAD-binding oxidoreductase [Pseudomonadota bacterium]